MKIFFLDDVRDAPIDTWTVVRTVPEFIKLVQSASSPITAISFDHDLGERAPGITAPTGMDAIKDFVNICLEKPRLAAHLTLIMVHSSNPARAHPRDAQSAQAHGVFPEETMILRKR